MNTLRETEAAARLASEMIADSYDFEQRVLCGNGGIDALRATNDAMARMIKDPIRFSRDPHIKD
jgi:hypothetical protein